MTAALVTVLTLWLVSAVIVTAAHNEARQAAKRRHPSWVGERAELVCMFCGERILVVPVDSAGVPVIGGVTLTDQLGAHDRECLARS